MEYKKYKCFSKNHKEIEAYNYFLECKVYMCKKCTIFHSDLCENHHSFEYNKNIKDQFISICSEENHFNNLDYFCKNHIKLCCVVWISKIKGKGND